MEQTLTISWTVVGTLCAVCATIVGVATAYLRLFIGVKLAEFKSEMLHSIKAEFAHKDGVTAQYDRMADRILRLEKKVFRDE